MGKNLFFLFYFLFLALINIECWAGAGVSPSFGATPPFQNQHPKNPSETLLYFTNHTAYQVCFTPQEDCTRSVIKLINTAQTQIRMQTYSFTSKPIAKALVKAAHRGVDVQIIYDVSNFEPEKNRLAKYLIKNHIPAYIDTVPGIAHNKVLIIDGNTVETGSFNYTYSAQENNAENVLIIHSSILANAYLNNWNFRKSQARIES